MTTTISTQTDSLVSDAISGQRWADSLTAFDHARFAALTSYRRSGAPVMTPVWVAREGQALYVITDADTGKIKRVRHHRGVQIAPCTGRGKPTGAAIDAVAHVLPAREDGWLFGALALWHRLQRKTPVLLELLESGAHSPTRDNR